MPTYTVWTFRCPRCKSDIGRRFGLITTLTIPCPNCRTQVRVDSNCIQQNWGFNFGWVGGVLLWFALAAGVLASPEFAAQIGRKTFPADTHEQRLVIAGVCALPAFLGALVIGGIGMVCGAIAAASMPTHTADPFDLTSPPPPGPRPGRPGQWGADAAGRDFRLPDVPRPAQRGFLARAFFALLWPVVVFLGAMAALILVALWTAKSDESPPAVAAGTVGLLSAPHGQGPLLAAAAQVPERAKDESMKQRAVGKLAERAAPWLLLAMLVTFGLGCAGLLPSTSRKLGTAAPSGVGRVLLRGTFVLVWPTQFFVGAVVALAAVSAGTPAQDEQVRSQVTGQLATFHVPWILLVSVLLFALGCAGVLPLTGPKRIRKPAD